VFLVGVRADDLDEFVVSGLSLERAGAAGEPVCHL